MFNKAYLKLKSNNPRGIPDEYTYWSGDDSIADVSADNYFDMSQFQPKSDPRANLTDPADTGIYKVYVTGADGSHTILVSADMATQLLGTYKSEIVINSPYQLAPPIDSSKKYIIDGIIDFTGIGFNIVIPRTGFSYKGLGSEISLIKCDDDNYDLFVSEDGGSGTLFGEDCAIEVSGTNSKVYNLTDATGFNAFEFSGINYNNCTSLGEINGYRQGLEVNTGRFGGAPELTLSGAWDGYRISTSIALNMSNLTSLFKAGDGLVFSGRFVTDINCNLPSTGALIDFSESNIANDESLILDGAYVRREGVINASDTTLYPNIDHASVKSNWGNNTGLPNTQKYIKLVCSAEVATIVVAPSTYYPLLGTMTAVDSIQFDSPVNGQIRLLTGNGLYNIDGTIQVKGTAGDLVDVRVTKSTDGGSTFPTQINHIQLEIANLSGPNDFATYSLNFSASLKKNDRIRLETENVTAARNVTMGTESFLIVTEV